jgi:uncharacterized membrane protein YeaQ/YmgE (transglycosylase-associated protein family)
MHYVWMFIVGIVVGAIARFVMPGSSHLGLLKTGLLGIAGSFIGGILSRIFSKDKTAGKLQPAGFLMSIVGAVLLLIIFGQLSH